MRLISSVKRLEAGAARAREEEPAAVGLVWSTHESKVEVESLADGEYVAVDVRLDRYGESAPGAVVDGQVVEPPEWWTIEERITSDPRDLGVVRDAEGVRVGRVVAIEGSMLTVQYDEEPPPASAWS